MNPEETAAGAVRIFDTTLRDGEQCPGASLTSEEKVRVAHQLARLGVDIIEAGFPAASPDDFAGVARIAAAFADAGSPTVAGLARAKREDIDCAWQAVRAAAHPRIHTFLATSPLHMERKLGMTPSQVLAQVKTAVARCRELCDDVEFSPEDATRSEPEFLVEVLSAAIAAGATTLNIPDTVGYALPDEYGALIRRLRAETAGGERAIWSVHCHDDLGLATANTLAGLAGGARQAEVTVNGLGERAGNASLEEVVMAIATRGARIGLTTGVVTREIAKSSRLVSHLTGFLVPPNKAIVGANAFAHEAGIHQHGMLRDERTYEIMRPETVGLEGTRLVLGKHSGRHAFEARLGNLGIELAGEALQDAFHQFKRLSERKRQVTDADLLALAHDEASRGERFQLLDLQVCCGRPGMPTATVRVSDAQGAPRTGSAIGEGPVEATFRAIQELVGSEARLLDFELHGATAGEDALGEATVRVAIDGRRVTGYGADQDIMVASAKAFLAALNRGFHGTEEAAQAPHASSSRGAQRR
ncbi:MAG TPA: 2-isopropylmalate synthase, partial [Thermoanaerobaculia bacterium]|nr:2-isopropylmalate synthase [Thermoanaerobaculia bacterium]